MKLKMLYFWIIFVVIPALVLSACSGAAPAEVPAVVVEEATLVSLCSDPRCGFANTFGDVHLNNLFVDRSVAGGAHVPLTTYISEVEVVTGKKITNAVLISHMVDNCPSCGGLKGSLALMDGSFNMPLEVGSYLRNSVPTGDAYLGLLKAQYSYVNQGVLNGWAGIQDNVSGRITPMLVWRDGVITNKIHESAWQSYLSNGGVMPTLAEEALPESARELLTLNANASVRYVEMAKAFDYASGSTIRSAVVTTSLDPVALSIFENGSTYVVTATNAGKFDMAGQLAYGLLHKQSSSGTPFRLYLHTQSNSELGSLLERLNHSSTFQSVISNPADDALVVWWQKSMQSRALRLSNVPMNKLVVPISGGSDAAVSMVRFSVPSVVSEVAVADAMADVGVVVEKSSLSRLVSVLTPYANATVRLLVWVGKVNDMMLAASIYYQVMAETGQVLFRYSPNWVLSDPGMGSYDPTQGNAQLYQQIWSNPYINLAATAEYSADMTSLWLHIQEQGDKGDVPCITLSTPDESMPLPIACAVEPYVSDEPKGIVFYGPDGQTMTSLFTHTNWDTSQTGAITWGMDTLDPATSCRWSAILESTPVTLKIRPLCNWK